MSSQKRLMLNPIRSNKCSHYRSNGTFFIPLSPLNLVRPNLPLVVHGSEEWL